MTDLSFCGAQLPQLIVTGHVRRGAIGAVIQSIDEDLARALSLDRPRGALIVEVEPEGPAEKAGIQNGDVVLAVNGQTVTRSEDLPRMVASHPPGSQVRLSVLRAARASDVSIVLAALPEETEHGARAQRPSNSPGSSSLGITVRDEDGRVVVERVDPDGPADGKLRPGDIVEEMNRQPIRSAGAFAATLRSVSPDKPLLLRVTRDGQPRYVAIEPAHL